MISFESLPELSLYIHVPWCVRKCPYCDFNSHELRSDLPQDDYVGALIRDLDRVVPDVWGRPVGSVFLGGGTPSLFSARSIETLLSACRARVNILADAEITLEANPASMEVQKFREFAHAGINRLSLGVQSFDDASLKSLGRIHDGDTARKAATEAMAIFPKVNLDLMYGLPGQSIDGLMADLEIALGLAVPHISVYQLTLEPNTRFAASPPPGLPPEDVLWEMQEGVLSRMKSAGYERYEISAFSKPGHRCLHNLNYWSFGDYLGIGAGAHAKLSFKDRIVRTSRVRHPKDYLGRAGSDAACDSVREVAVADLAFEFMLNALRLTEGVAVPRWRQTTGLLPAEHPFLLERLVTAQTKGLLAQDPLRWRATPKGLDFLNDLQAMFLA